MCTTGWAQRPPLSTGIWHASDANTQFKIAPSSSFRYKFWACLLMVPTATTLTVERRQLKDCLEHSSCMIVREGNKPNIPDVGDSQYVDKPDKYIQSHYLTGRKRVAWPFCSHNCAGIAVTYQTGIPSIDSDPHKARTCSPNGTEVRPCTLLVKYNGRGIKHAFYLTPCMHDYAEAVCNYMYVQYDVQLTCIKYNNYMIIYTSLMIYTNNIW